MTTTNGNATQRTWLDDTEDMLDGDFVKFDDGDEKVLKVVSNPRAGPVEFTQSDGTKKFNDGLNIEVLVGDNPKIKTWSVTSKSLMQQIKAICIKERLGPELAGSVLRVTASGTGMQRKYFVKLLQRPGAAAASPVFTPATTGPAIQQQATQMIQRGGQERDAAAQRVGQQDPGTAWIEQQRVGAQ